MQEGLAGLGTIVWLFGVLVDGLPDLSPQTVNNPLENPMTTDKYRDSTLGYGPPVNNCPVAKSQITIMCGLMITSTEPVFKCPQKYQSSCYLLDRLSLPT